MKSSYQDFFKPGHAEINRLCKFMSINALFCSFDTQKTHHCFGVFFHYKSFNISARFASYSSFVISSFSNILLSFSSLSSAF